MNSPDSFPSILMLPLRYSRFICLLWVAVILCLGHSSKSHACSCPQNERVPDFSRQSDDELAAGLDEILQQSRFQSDGKLQPLLLEIQNRGGEKWRDFLRSRLEILSRRTWIERFTLDENGQSDSKIELVDHATPKQAADFPEKFYEAQENDADVFVTLGRSKNIEILTILRRLEGNPDPLQIDLDVPNQPWFIDRLANVKLRIGLRNNDAEKVTFDFETNGVSDGTRDFRWHIKLVGHGGAESEPRTIRMLNIGGITGMEELAFDKSWNCEIAIRDYLVLPHSGEYEMTVSCSANDLAELIDGLGGEIEFHSKPVSVVIRPIELLISRQELEIIERLIAEVPNTLPVSVVAGTYGEWAHELVPPDSASGKILSHGLNAIPSLLSKLDDPKLTVNRRAWILSLLFTLTGENDPRGGLFSNSPAIGFHYYLQSGFDTFGGTNDKPVGNELGVIGSNWPAYWERHKSVNPPRDYFPYAKEISNIEKMAKAAGAWDAEDVNRESVPDLDVQLQLAAVWKSWKNEFHVTLVD